MAIAFWRQSQVVAAEECSPTGIVSVPGGVEFRGELWGGVALRSPLPSAERGALPAHRLQPGKHRLPLKCLRRRLSPIGNAHHHRVHSTLL